MNGETSVDIVLSCAHEPEAVRKLRALRDAGLLGDVTVKLRSRDTGNVVACWSGENFLGCDALSKEIR